MGRSACVFILLFMRTFVVPAREPEKFLMPLHVFVWVEKNGLIEPDPDGRQRSIHHKNEDNSTPGSRTWPWHSGC